MRPELRMRLVDSIEYLRKMGFFQDYPNLTSEEILERIFNGEIEYPTDLYNADWSNEELKSGRQPHGAILKESIEEKEDEWMRKGDDRIDYELAFFDRKRVMVQDVETDVIKGAGIGLIKRIVKISRGVFQPVILQERLKIKETPLERDWWRDEDAWSSFIVRFEWRGEEHKVKIFFYKDYLHCSFVKDINRIIENTGYRYYTFGELDMYLTLVLLNNEEAEKLRKERGWKLYRW